MTTSDFFALFTYGANWNIQMNLLFLLGAVIYLLITGPLLSKIPNAKPVPPKQKFYFLTGWAIYYLAMGSPLSLLAHELFSMHMLQMSILYIVMPPFFLLGLPAWLLRLMRFRPLTKIGAFFSKPIISLFSFNGLISVYHFPVIFDAIMDSLFLHYVSHIILLGLALCVWWTIVCPLPEYDRVKPLHKLAFIFANGVLLTPACALIIFADQPLFASYERISDFAIMPPLLDQALGGVIMKITQEFVYIVAIGIVFVRWFRAQRKHDEQEIQDWANGEPALK